MSLGFVFLLSWEVLTLLSPTQAQKKQTYPEKDLVSIICQSLLVQVYLPQDISYLKFVDKIL